jgi:putative phosphonate metabolism protein
MTGGPGRYAVYFTPEPGSALAEFGARWLGWDIEAGTPVVQPAIASIDPERLRTITAEPRRYGFHGTLKPPFVLADGTSETDLSAAVASLAAQVSAFAAPRLRLMRIAGFWALTVSEPCPPLDGLAKRCVRELDRFRAAPAAAELERRRRAGLSSRQETLLQRWGYPYVMEEFRFHMTLTGRLDGTESAAVGAALAPLVAPLCQASLPIDAIGLLHQPSAELPFRLLRRCRLKPPSAAGQ